VSGPLDGFRVVEIAEGVAGPQASMMLADAGAEVIKIEGSAGDRSRTWSPVLDSGDGAVFDSLNRNKRGVCLDLASDAAPRIIEALVSHSDILLVDDQAQVPPGLDYDTLRTRHPELIHCSISAWGPEGPWRDRAGGELPAQLASEWTTTVGSVDAPPVRLGADVASGHAATYAAQAICAALFERFQSGVGQRVDVSLFGALVALRSKMWVTQSNPDDWGGYRLNGYVSPPDSGYTCADGRILVRLTGPDVEARIERVVDALDMAWVRDDPLWPKFRSDTPGGTGLFTEELRPLWDRGLSKWTCAEALRICREHDVLAFPFHDYAALVADEQVRHLDVVQAYEGVPYVTSPWQFADTPVSIRRGPPRLGEHTIEVLRAAGFSEGEVAEYLAHGVAIEAEPRV
jgi:crotonobetainyl-CoA:carnitine CoA-transferase CaiB-like acyl-CoA transferase